MPRQEVEDGELTPEHAQTPQHMISAGQLEDGMASMRVHSAQPDMVSRHLQLLLSYTSISQSEINDKLTKSHNISNSRIMIN